mmetsp:Transcript_62555/g.167537  ORF Transcript_62555/g.167537 Transcript_62555/m.167537 type:complete len:217 (+) Transcript_62555:100-750(+)
MLLLHLIFDGNKSRVLFRGFLGLLALQTLLELQFVLLFLLRIQCVLLSSELVGDDLVVAQVPPHFVHNDDVEPADACYRQPQGGSLDNRGDQVRAHELHNGGPPPPQEPAQRLIQYRSNLAQHSTHSARPVKQGRIVRFLVGIRLVLQVAQLRHRLLPQEPHGLLELLIVAPLLLLGVRRHQLRPVAPEIQSTPLQQLLLLLRVLQRVPHQVRYRF